MLTISDAKAWAEARRESLDIARLAHADPMVRLMNNAMPEKSKTLGDSGCWLAAVIREHGATDQQVRDIQMAVGQRAFGGDAWQAAVDYANEFVAKGDTEEKGGLELAVKINSELEDVEHEGFEEGAPRAPFGREYMEDAE